MAKIEIERGVWEKIKTWAKRRRGQIERSHKPFVRIRKRTHKGGLLRTAQGKP